MKGFWGGEKKVWTHYQNAFFTRNILKLRTIEQINDRESTNTEANFTFFLQIIIQRVCTQSYESYQKFVINYITRRGTKIFSCVNWHICTCMKRYNCNAQLFQHTNIFKCAFKTHSFEAQRITRQQLSTVLWVQNYRTSYVFVNHTFLVPPPPPAF